MTPDNDDSREIRTVIDLAAVARAQMGGLDRPSAVCELVDNFLDRTYGSSPEIYITYEKGSRENSLLIRMIGTTGMPVSEMQRLLTFGNLSRTGRQPDSIGTFGLGGKLAALWHLSPTGDLQISSTPPGSRESYELSLNEWWKHLTSDSTWMTTTKKLTRSEPNGSTTFHLRRTVDQASPSDPTDLIKLAVRLGLTYSRAISKGLKLSLGIQHLEGHGKASEVTVMPVVIPIDRTGRYYGETKKTTVTQGVTATMVHGMIDHKLRDRQSATLAKEYSRMLGLKKPIPADALPAIIGNRVYYIVNGRVLGFGEDLRFYRPEGTTSRPFEQVVAVVIIDIDPSAPQEMILDLFKGGIARSTRQGSEIRGWVASQLAPTIKRIMIDSRGEHDVSNKHTNVLTKTALVLPQILEGAFGQLSDVSEAFGLVTTGRTTDTLKRVIQAPTRARSQEKSHRTPALPGSALPSARKNREEKPTQNDGESLEFILTLDHLGEGKIGTLDLSEKDGISVNVVTLNADSSRVQRALQLASATNHQSNHDLIYLSIEIVARDRLLAKSGSAHEYQQKLDIVMEKVAFALRQE